MHGRNLLISFDELIQEAASSTQQEKEATDIPTSQSSYATQTQVPTIAVSFAQSMLNFEKINEISGESSLNPPNNIDNNNIDNKIIPKNNKNNNEGEKTIIFVVTFLSVFLFVISIISLVTRRRFLLRKANGGGGGTKSDLLFSSIGMLPMKPLASANSSSSSSRKKGKVRWYDLQQQPQDQEEQLSKQFNDVFNYYDTERHDSLDNRTANDNLPKNMNDMSSINDDNENMVDLRYPVSNISTLSNDDRASHITSTIGGSQRDTLETNSLDEDLENNATDNASHSSDTSFCLGAVSLHRIINEKTDV